MKSGNATSPLHSRGSPNNGRQNQNWLPHPCLLGSPEICNNVTSPLHSRGVAKQRGTKSELVASPLPSRGPKKERKCHVTPCILGGRQTKGGQNQNWLPHNCLLGGPEMCRNATSPRHSRGSPNKGGQNQKWLPHTLPSRGPKRGRKCHVTPAFSGIAKQRGTKSKLAASPLPS